jgi:glucosylglycerol-phosphate synthase
MNLVCKEFLAAKVDNFGILVLSEFAGAAVELGNAVITNPFSNRSMDLAILQALEMEEPERCARMKAMRQAVRDNNIASWHPKLIEDMAHQNPFEARHAAE